MKINNAAKFIIAILLAQFAGFVGSIFTSPSIPGWYARLTKPSFTPPSWVFAPVWTTLFFLMGVAAFLVWKKGLDKKTVKVALVFFLLQLAFNSLWSYIFFGLHNLFLAFLEIIVLWLLILVTIILFWRVSKLAAWLLLPYIFWVGFAAFLNLFPFAKLRLIFNDQDFCFRVVQYEFNFFAAIALVNGDCHASHSHDSKI
jgi:tryptophan-rich sensory protein